MYKLKPEKLEYCRFLWGFKFPEKIQEVERIANEFGRSFSLYHVCFAQNDFYKEDEKMIETNHDLGHAPKHYEQACAKIEPREFLRYLPFQLGNACKYILRYQYKGHPLEDLKKALDYLEWASEAYEEPISEKVFVLVPYFDNQILDVLFNAYEEDEPEINYDDAIAFVREQIALLENGNEN